MLSKQTISLKSRALKLLASRERSRAEVKRKLAEFEEEPGQLAQLLDELQAKGFLDDARAASSHAARRGQKLGSARVLQELKARGLQGVAIEEAKADLKSTELERAREVWRKKFGAPAHEASERAKQMRFLVTRGFSAEIIRRIVTGIEE
jgi:regulatory protein